MRLILAGLATAVLVAAAQQPRSGVVLGDLTWQEAEAALTPASVVVIPLGAAALEGGPQLRLDNDERLARYLAQRVRAAADVVIAPPLSYHFYSAFAEYPGTASLSQNTARDMTADVVRSLSKHGPRRFYVLNTGTTTLGPLKSAADALADQGILLGYTDMRYRLVNARVARQQGGTRGTPHADEMETSMMLFVDPARVDMRKAVREYGTGAGALTKVKDGPGIYSASGVNGDPTLATRDKGQGFVEALVTAALDDIDWQDEIRVFLEERASFSPDALTGMEANLRFGGPETMESKIFARLTAWQNWIFQRPNAVGEEGALKRYGTGQKAAFDTKRV